MREEVFKIVVVGEFSRGKSTVINALLGARVLPSSPRPTTALLSCISFGETPRFAVHFRDGRSAVEVSSEYLAKLVAPPEPLLGDDESAREYEQASRQLHEIAYLQIHYPCELCRSGVSIIDTPGTNDLDQAREEITYKYIPNADAVLFVLSAASPATASELEFLRDRVMAADLGKIFMVMNFSDTLDTAVDRDRVISHAKNDVSAVVPCQEIYLISARQALYHKLGQGKTKLSLTETGYPRLESELARFLASESGWVRLMKPMNRAVRIAAELAGQNLQMQRRKYQLPAEELRIKADQIRPYLQRVIIQRNSALASFRTSLTLKGQDLAREWQKGLEEIASVAEKTLSSYQGELEEESLIRSVERVAARPQSLLNQKMQIAERDAIIDATRAADNRLQAAWDNFHIEFDRVFSSDTSPESPNDVGDQGQTNAAGKSANIFEAYFTEFWVAAPFEKLAMAVCAVPFLLFATIYSWVSASERTTFIDRMRTQIEGRFRNAIPRFVENWNTRWAERTLAAAQGLRAECDRKVCDLQHQLDGIMMEHGLADASAQEELSRLDRLEHEIGSIRERIGIIKGERTRNEL
jgi:GTPase SAR1 family protein